MFTRTTSELRCSQQKSSAAYQTNVLRFGVLTQVSTVPMENWTSKKTIKKQNKTQQTQLILLHQNVLTDSCNLNTFESICIHI